MKKVLSFLLAIAMLFSVSSVPAMAKPTNGSDPDYLGAYANEEVGDGIIFNSDGTFVAFTDFENETGKALGTYEVDGSDATLYSPYLKGGQQTGTWDGKTWSFGGDTYTSTVKVLPIALMSSYDIYLNGNLDYMLGNSLSSIENDKMKTTEKMDKTMVEPGEIYTVDVTLKKATAQLQVINPYENTVPLNKCIICSFYTDDTSKTFSMDTDGHHCGEDNFDALLNFNVYSYTADTLVYKPHLMILNSGSASKDTGEQLLIPSGDAELTLKFNGSTLTSFQFTFPDLLYNGLNDNMDADTLADMSADKIAAATEIRNNILDDLQAEFKKAKLNLTVNEQTGEIVMDNEVLFKKNSYEISDEGKEYLDAFIGVYGSVLFSDKYIDSISAIHFEGHTDSDGDYGYNQILSQKRAQAVLDYCISSTDNDLSDDQKDNLEDLSTATGYSCSDPVYDEDGNEDKDASRRAVIKFYIDVK